MIFAIKNLFCGFLKHHKTVIIVVVVVVVIVIVVIVVVVIVEGARDLVACTLLLLTKG